MSLCLNITNLRHNNSKSLKEPTPKQQKQRNPNNNPKTTKQNKAPLNAENVYDHTSMICYLELKLQQYNQSGIGKTPEFLIHSQAYSLDPGRNCKPSTFILFSVNLFLLLAFLFLLMSPFSFAYDFSLSEIFQGLKRLNFTVMEPGR